MRRHYTAPMSDAATDAMLVDAPTPRRGRGALTALGAFAIYLMASVVVWGGSTVTRLDTYYITRQDSPDPYFFRWAMTWVPWAIAHGRDPLVTDVIYAPYPVTLTWVTLAPGPAIAMWPVTRAFGSLVSYNVLTLLAPALAGWAAFLLCRRLTHRFWASLAGGLFFGFSTFIANQMNHPNLALAFPIPLLVYLVVRRLEGSLRRWTFIVLVGVTLVALWSISLELFATTTVFGGIAMLIALIIAREDRPKLWSTTLQIGVGYAIAGAVVFVPYLLPALQTAPQAVMRDNERSSDPLQLFFPENRYVVEGAWLQEMGARYKGHVYVGFGIIAVLIGFAITEWRRRWARALLVFIGICILFAMGPTLWVGGHSTIPLPMSILRKLPLLQQAIPSRIIVFAYLGVAVVVATWLAAARGRGVWIRVGVVLVAITLGIPAIQIPPWHMPDATPAFFTDGSYRSLITAGETVLVIPRQAAQPMSWQATADFWFRMPNGYVGITTQGVTRDPVNGRLAGSGRLPSGEELRTWLDRHGVTAIVVEDVVLGHFEPALEAAGFGLVQQIGGVSVWRPV
jgi:hypothetical protein